MNTRKDNNGRATKAWKNTPPGHIAKPLRHIGNRTIRRRADGTVELSDEYLQARAAARAGQGHIVAAMARSLGY